MSQTHTNPQHTTEPNWTEVSEFVAAHGYSPIALADDCPPLWRLRHRAARINGAHGTQFSINDLEGCDGTYRVDTPWSGLHGLDFDDALFVLEGAALGLEHSWRKRNAPEIETHADDTDYVPEPDWAAVRLVAKVAAFHREPTPSADDRWPALWRLRHEAESINGRHGTDFAIYEPEPLLYRITHDTWSTKTPVPFEEAASILRGIAAGLGVTAAAA